MRRVATTYATDEATFNPVDFTESDLSEATKVFEAAARKHVTGFDGAIGSYLSDFRAAMNTAEGNFPEGAEKYSINEINFSEFPIIIVNLTGAVPLRWVSKPPARTTRF